MPPGRGQVRRRRDAVWLRFPNGVWLPPLAHGAPLPPVARFGRGALLAFADFSLFAGFGLDFGTLTIFHLAFAGAGKRAGPGFPLLFRQRTQNNPGRRPVRRCWPEWPGAASGAVEARRRRRRGGKFASRGACVSPAPWPGASPSRRPRLSSVRAKSSGARCPPRRAASRSAFGRSDAQRRVTRVLVSFISLPGPAHSISACRTAGTCNCIQFNPSHSFPVRTSVGAFRQGITDKAPASGSASKTLTCGPSIRAACSHLPVPMPNPIGRRKQVHTWPRLLAAIRRRRLCPSLRIPSAPQSAAWTSPAIVREAIASSTLAKPRHDSTGFVGHRQSLETILCQQSLDVGRKLSEAGLCLETPRKRLPLDGFRDALHPRGHPNAASRQFSAMSGTTIAPGPRTKQIMSSGKPFVRVTMQVRSDALPRRQVRVLVK